ncbi:MAG: flippase [Flavobacteriales bacterium]|nr:flippase [Flavobacteriales bacterium]
MIKRIRNRISNDQNVSDILSKGGISFFSRLLSFFISYIFLLFVSNFFSEQAVGLYQLSNSILIISALVVSLGFQRSIVRFASSLKEKGKYLECYNLIISFLKRIIPIGVALGIVCFFFAEELSIKVFKDIEMRECLMIVGITLPFFTLYLIFVELFRSFQQFKRSEFFKYILVWLIAIILCLSFFYTFRSNWAPLLAYALATILTFLVMLPLVVKDLKELKRSGLGGSVKELDLRSYFKISAPMIITGLSFIFLIRMDFIMLGIFQNVSIEEVGIYGVAVKMGVLANFGNNAIQRMAAPRISAMFWDGKMDQLRKLLTRLKQVNLIFTLPVCVILFTFPEFILSFFGEEYKSGVHVMRIITAAYFINAFFGLSGVFMNMTGNERPFSLILIITLTINLVLNILLIPHYGMLGPAYSTLLCFFLWNITTTIFMQIKYKLKMYYIPFLTD